MVSMEAKRLKIVMLVECPKQPASMGCQNIGACSECKYLDEFAVDLGYIFCNYKEEKNMEV